MKKISQLAITITEFQLYSPTRFLWFGSKAALSSLGLPQYFVHIIYIHAFLMSHMTSLFLSTSLFT